MTFVPLKIGSPANDLLRLNRFWNKVHADVAGDGMVVGDFRFARMWHADCDVDFGLVFIDTVSGEPNSKYPYYSSWRILPTNGALFSQQFILSAGTYDFIVTGCTSTQSGILQWSLDGEAIGSMDLYSSPDDAIAVMTIADVVVASSGQHTLTGLVNSRHASSIGYQAILYKYCFRESA